MQRWSSGHCTGKVGIRVRSSMGAAYKLKRQRRNGPDEQIAARAERTVGGQPLLQKDFHDPLRRVAIPEFRTFSLLTVAGQYLARFRIYTRIPSYVHLNCTYGDSPDTLSPGALEDREVLAAVG